MLNNHFIHHVAISDFSFNVLYSFNIIAVPIFIKRNNKCPDSQILKRRILFKRFTSCLCKLSVLYDLVKITPNHKQCIKTSPIKPLHVPLQVRYTKSALIFVQI